jgi:hypothetical protein
MDEWGIRDCDISHLIIIIKNQLKSSPSLLSNGYRELFQTVELTPIFIQSQVAWSSTSNPSFVFIVWCLIEERIPLHFRLSLLKPHIFLLPLGI